MSTGNGKFRARHGHDRRPQREGAEGHRPRRDGRVRRHRDPRLLLRAPARACRRRLPDVSRRDRRAAEAAGRLHARRPGRDGRPHRRHVREGRRGPERDARVHPRQPSARLPRLRQGRRVPAAGPDVPLRARQHAHDLPEAHAREADPDLADDRARPRALHPLLPLHPLLVGRGGGQPAHRPQPRRPQRDRDVRGRSVPGAVLGQRDRVVPRRRTHLDPVPVRGAAVGHPERADRLRRSARSAATSPPRSAKARSSASSRATIPRSTAAGCATRAGSPTRTCWRADRITEPLARGPLGLEPIAWDDALDRVEALLRGAEGRIVTALSGSETLEQAYGLARLLRGGLGAHSAVLPESTSVALDAFRLPLSAIADAQIVVDRRRRRGGRPRPCRRALAQGRRTERRRGRPCRSHRLGQVAARHRSSHADRARGAGQRAGRPRAGRRAGDSDLVRSGRRGRRPARRGRGCARASGQARQRRVPPTRDAERARGSDCLGRSSRRGRNES